VTTYLLLHAFPFDASMWSEVSQRLRADGHEVIAPDLTGFGTAPLGSETPSIDRMVADVVTLIGDDPVVVAGCSMGGYVALGIARRDPALVSALVLVDTKATADGEAARANRERVAVLAESGEGWSTGMIDGLLGATTRASNLDLVSHVEQVLASAPRATVAWAQRAMAARPDSVDVLASLDVPVLVVMGEEDTMSPMPEQQIMVDAAADAHLVVIPGSGHLSPLEAPDAVAAALRAQTPR